jgi:hypothetical protein
MALANATASLDLFMNPPWSVPDGTITDPDRGF